MECAAIARFARFVLLAAGLLACSALYCASAWFILVTNEAPLLVRVSAGRGQPLCPWDRGDKVVSSCWWVRACFIHPETLFQTLSQKLSTRSTFKEGDTQIVSSGVKSRRWKPVTSSSARPWVSASL